MYIYIYVICLLFTPLMSVLVFAIVLSHEKQTAKYVSIIEKPKPKPKI